MDKAGFGVVVIVNGREIERKEENLARSIRYEGHDFREFFSDRENRRKLFIKEQQGESGLREKVKGLSVCAIEAIGGLLFYLPRFIAKYY